MDIRLQEVSKTFNGGNTRATDATPVGADINATKALKALHSITLDIASGEFVGIIGPSGCGKSTLLRLIADQIQPSAGKISLEGSPPALARAHKAIAWMAQNPALLPWQTVLENVQLPLRVNRGVPSSGLSPSALLKMVGLMEFADVYPSTLSGGMQQRVALARALVTGAPLWLMDEPFAALDELTRETLTEEVLRLWAQFRPTVLWVTHQITEAVRMADRIVVMTARPGRIGAIMPVTLPRPRDETSSTTIDLVRQLRALLRD
jgi:NitT/TauT family transport system ATP-binding protein